jgi:hypothetical protein
MRPFILTRQACHHHLRLALVGRGREGPSDDPSMQQSIALEKTPLSKRVVFETLLLLNSGV